jgi:hypothetical protein
MDEAMTHDLSLLIDFATGDVSDTRLETKSATSFAENGWNCSMSCSAFCGFSKMSLTFSFRTSDSDTIDASRTHRGKVSPARNAGAIRETRDRDAEVGREVVEETRWQVCELIGAADQLGRRGRTKQRRQDAV